MNPIEKSRSIAIERFAKGEIPQAELLNLLRNEVFSMYDDGIKPSQIADYIHNIFGVKISMNSFYQWLRYHKKAQRNSNSVKLRHISTPPLPGAAENNGKNTLDILTSTDYV